MNISTKLKLCSVSILCAAALVACGGGSNSSTSTSTTTAPATDSVTTPDTTATPALFDVKEYAGTWKVDAPVCNSGFPYGDYWYALTELSLAEKEVVTTHTVYNDAACTSKAGRVKETFDPSWSLGSVSGKTNVAKLKLAFVGSSSGADGSTGLTMNKFPNGSLIGSSKLLLDVDADKLFGHEDAPVDADGYPSALKPNSFASKQP